MNFATAAAAVAEPTEVPEPAAEEPATEEPMMMMAQSQALYTTGAITGKPLSPTSNWFIALGIQKLS